MSKVVQTSYYCDCCLRKIELEALHHTLIRSDVKDGPFTDTEVDFCNSCLSNRLSFQITAKIPRTCQSCGGRGKIKGRMLSSGPNNGDYEYAVDVCIECWCGECPRVIPDKW